MFRNVIEALLITAYALVLNFGVLTFALFAFEGPQGLERYFGWSIFLLFVASCAVFGTALFALRRGPIDSASRGIRIGLAAAFVFYALILIMFGVIPSLSALSSGEFRKASAYLGEIVQITAIGSYGLPIITGAFGGALYGWIRGRRAAA